MSVDRSGQQVTLENAFKNHFPASYQELDQDFLKKVAYITTNETEGHLLTGVKFRDEQSAHEAAIVLAKGDIPKRDIRQMRLYIELMLLHLFRLQKSENIKPCLIKKIQLLFYKKTKQWVNDQFTDFTNGSMKVTTTKMIESTIYQKVHYLTSKFFINNPSHLHMTYCNLQLRVFHLAYGN